MALEIVLPGLVALAAGVGRIFSTRWASDTAYYQAIALKASREGRWWTLGESEIPYFNKPPLCFWMHAAAALITGESGWGSRVPELLAFIITCVVTGLIGRRVGGRAAGVIAGLAMALCWEWIWRVSNFRLDFHATGFMLGVVWCLIEHDARVRRGLGPWNRGWNGWGWVICAGLCVAAALMCKPFYGVLAPAFFLLWRALCRRAPGAAMDPARIPGDRGRRSGVAAAGLCVIIGVAGAGVWHVDMLLRHGSAFWNAYVLVQSVSRGTGRMFDAEPWWWYLSYLIGRGDGTSAWPTWPLAAGVLGGVLMIAARWRERARDRRVRAAMLGAVWGVGWLALLSAFADKRNYYLLVVYPGLAIATGAALATLIARVRGIGVRRSVRAWRATLAVIGVGACALTLVSVVRQDHRVQLRERQEHLRSAGVWLGEHSGGAAVYNAGMRYTDAALMYVLSNVWPRTLVEKAPVALGDLPIGSLGVHEAGWIVEGGASSEIGDVELARFGTIRIFRAMRRDAPAR